MRTKYKKNSIATKLYQDFVTFVIICDLHGYRMKSYGSTSLLQIGQDKLIDSQIKIIDHFFSKYEIILCLGFDAESTIKYIRQKYSHNNNIRIIENQLFEKYNSCESLRLSLNNTVNDKIFVIDGGILLNKQCFKNMSLDNNYLFSQSISDGLDIGFNINENKKIEYISYGGSSVWSEILYINGKDIEFLKRVLSTGNFKNKFIFEVINELIKMKITFLPLKNKIPVKKINNIKSYNDIKE